MKTKTFDRISRDQFDHVCKVLQKKKIPITKESVVEYIESTGNQKSKFLNRIKKHEADKANTLRLQWAQYLQTIKCRVKIPFVNYHIIWYKKGSKGKFGRLDIVKGISR